MVICSRELGQVITAPGVGGDSLPLGKQESERRHVGMCWVIYSPRGHNVNDPTPLSGVPTPKVPTMSQNRTTSLDQVVNA